MIEQSKINEARETAKKKQQELARARANQPKDGRLEEYERTVVT